MSTIVNWNEMPKIQRRIVMDYAMSVANEEKKFDDDMGKFLKKELKRLDSSRRYNGATPLLFKDHFGIVVEFGNHATGQFVLSLNNAKCQGELATVALLLCQAKYCFNEKDLSDIQFFHIINAMTSVGERELFLGLAIYSRPLKKPKELKDWL